MFVRWYFTVRTLICKTAAISSFVCPFSIRRKTLFSVSVKACATFSAFHQIIRIINSLLHCFCQNASFKRSLRFIFCNKTKTAIPSSVHCSKSAIVLGNCQRSRHMALPSILSHAIFQNRINKISHLCQR